jgi:hypothetical protein
MIDPRAIVDKTLKCVLVHRVNYKKVIFIPEEYASKLNMQIVARCLTGFPGCYYYNSLDKAARFYIPYGKYVAGWDTKNIPLQPEFIPINIIEIMRHAGVEFNDYDIKLNQKGMEKINWEYLE